MHINHCTPFDAHNIIFFQIKLDENACDRQLLERKESVTKEAEYEIDQSKLNEVGKLWLRMIACIIHDLTTPLAIVRMAGQTIANLFPDLVSGYPSIDEHHQISASQREKNIKIVEENLAFLSEKSVYEMQVFLNSLYPYCKKLFSDPLKHSISIEEFIESILEKYQFNSARERHLLYIDYKKDFKFTPMPPFTEYLLEHLLSEAIKASRESDENKISISASVDENGRDILYFMYSVDPKNKVQEKIFDKFFLNQNGEMVPGLGFCKLALVQNNGNVLCEVIEDRVQFSIYFPNKMSM